MAKNLYEFLHPNEAYNENDIPRLSDEEINLIKEACAPDYVRIIQYLEKKEKQNKLRNNIVFICTILAAIFAAISAIPIIMQYLN